MKDLYIVAQVLRPHGRRGEVVLRPLTDHMETLTSAAIVYLGLKADKAVAVEGIRLHKSSPLLKLEGVNDMDAATALRGQDICIPLEELEPLQEGEYFLHDLVGLAVIDHQGQEVGPVEHILETGGPPILAGPGRSGKEFMVPFASGTIDEVDLEAGTIRLIDLPGLIEEADG